MRERLCSVRLRSWSFGRRNVVGWYTARRSPMRYDVSKISTPMRWTFLVVAIFLVIFLRSPDVLIEPPLEAEDGTFVFQHFYVHRGAAEIFRFKTGYIPLVANAIAYLSVRLPVRAIPYAFAWIPCAMTLVVYTWLFGERFRAWLGCDATRATLCLLFALVPVTQWHLMVHTDYSIWNTLLVLWFIALRPLPASRAAAAAVWTVANVFVWSHPLSILVAPLFLFRMSKEREHRWVHVATLVNLAAHQAFGVERFTGLSGLGPADLFARLASDLGWTAVIIARTAFRTAFGVPQYDWALGHGGWMWFFGWTAVVLMAAAVAARRSHRLRVLFAVLAYAIVSITFLSVLARGAATASQLDDAPRYVYLQSLAFIALGVVLLDTFFSVEGDDAPRWRRRPVVLGAALVYALALNAQLGHYFVATGIAARPDQLTHSAYLPNHPDNGRIVREFFRDLEALERANGSRDGIHLTAEKIYDWRIVIDTPPAR